MNKSTLKITIAVLIFLSSFNASATGGGKKPDPSFNRNHCWYSVFVSFLPVTQYSHCLISGKVKHQF